jgi:hypothetical protein
MLRNEQMAMPAAPAVPAGVHWQGRCMRCQLAQMKTVQLETLQH